MEENFDLLGSVGIGARFLVEVVSEVSNKVSLELWFEEAGQGLNFTSGQGSIPATATAAEPRSKAVSVAAWGISEGRLDMLVAEVRLEPFLDPEVEDKKIEVD